MFACMECGKSFRSDTAAEHASVHGCPRCGGVDIDLDPRKVFPVEGGHIYRPGWDDPVVDIIDEPDTAA